MPLKLSSALRRHTRPRFANALLAALALALVCLFVLPDGPAHAQRRGNRAASQTANDNASAARTGTTKRVYVGGGSSTPHGSRVTIKSDNPLNDYSAYRSGDRFYVVVPGASAGSVAKGGSGRGYSDMQVQQRGKDVVLSYKVQPGAKPKVEQKFNRLDVVFEAAEGAGATPDNTRAAKPPTPARPTPVANTQAGNQTPAQAASQGGAERKVNRPAANATAGTGQSNASAPSINPSAPPAGFVEPGTQSAQPPVAEQMPAATPIQTPAAEQQLAQAAQPPTTTAPITSTTQTNAQQTGTSIGAVVMRNWPLALILGLLVVGVGLFIAARRTSATSPPPHEVPAEAGGTAAQVAGARAAKLKGASASPTLRAVESKSAAGTSSAAATLAAAGLGSAAAVEDGKEKKKKKGKESAREEKAVAGDDAGAVTSAETFAKGAALSGLVAAAALSEQTEPSVQQEVVGDVKGIEPAVALDGDVVQIETKRLLDGEAFDARVVGTSDVMARQMIAAELLAALAGRNVERQARARAAFVKHGYFDEAVIDLRGASAPAERASAARSLGLTAQRTATPHLVAALEDSMVEVRRAAVESLASLRDPAAVEPLETLLERERKQKTKVNRKLVLHAIDACREGLAELPAVASAPVAESTTVVEEMALDAGAGAATEVPADEVSPVVPPATATAIEPLVDEVTAVEHAESAIVPVVSEESLAESAPVAVAAVESAPAFDAESLKSGANVTEIEAVRENGAVAPVRRRGGRSRERARTRRRRDTSGRSVCG
ncbi:MAG: HEAT repeat domain-containing protein [Acidobacteria bacterium]|nr:HEAT repeat domain-containing protein [Acidobacteriota bacterium]